MPGNIVEYEHTVRMVEAVDHSRDKALVATQWDGGLRPMEELYPVQFKHIDIRDDHVVINLPEQDGKTDKRQVLLIVAAPLLKRWILRKHPVHDDLEASLGPETFIWTKQNENSLPHYNTIGERFRVAGERADLSVSHRPSISGGRRRRSTRGKGRPLAGQPIAVVGLLLGLSLGITLVHRDMPTIDEATAKL